MQISETDSISDKFRWIVTGSMYSDLLLIFSKYLKNIFKDFNINKNLITRVIHKIRKIIGMYLEEDPIRLGGQGSSWTCT